MATLQRHRISTTDNREGPRYFLKASVKRPKSFGVLQSALKQRKQDETHIFLLTTGVLPMLHSLQFQGAISVLQALDKVLLTWRTNSTTKYAEQYCPSKTERLARFQQAYGTELTSVARRNTLIPESLSKHSLYGLQVHQAFSNPHITI